MAEKLTLASMCAGGVQERIDRALAKISDNILDLNTDAKKKRTLDIKIVLTHQRMIEKMLLLRFRLPLSWLLRWD